jgi:hypothetical protein
VQVERSAKQKTHFFVWHSRDAAYLRRQATVVQVEKNHKDIFINEYSWDFMVIRVLKCPQRNFLKHECSSMPMNAHKDIFINEYSWDFMVIRVPKCPQRNFSETRMFINAHECS